MVTSGLLVPGKRNGGRLNNPLFGGIFQIPTQIRKILIINAMVSLQVEQSVRSAHARATFSIENERA
jgi:hypothetical protein